MGRRTKEEKVRVKSRGTLNTGLHHHLVRKPTLIYLPLKSCLFCHHLVKLLYLGRKRHPCRNPGVTSMRTSQHPAQVSTLGTPSSPLIPRSISPPILEVSFVSGALTTEFLCPPVALRIPSGHLPRRAAGSWPECQWCPSLPGSAGHLGHASSSGDPCKDPESKDSNVSQLWSAEQA